MWPNNPKILVEDSFNKYALEICFAVFWGVMLFTLCECSDEPCLVYSEQIFGRPFKFGPNVYLLKNSSEGGLGLLFFVRFFPSVLLPALQKHSDTQEKNGYNARVSWMTKCAL